MRVVGLILVIALLAVLVPRVLESGSVRPHVTAGRGEGAAPTVASSPSEAESSDDGSPITGVPVDPADPRLVPDPRQTGGEFPPGYQFVLARDVIRPIYEPTYRTAEDTDWADETLVLGVEIQGESRAYPINVLNRREMVLDRLGGTPILASWCPLCATAMVHRREIDGEEIMLGNQGDLYLNAMTWWDHGTGTIWSQPSGTAIVGPLAGKQLELLPSTLTDWGTWRRERPETLALDADGGPTRFDLANMVVAVDLGGQPAAYRVSDLREVGVFNDVVGEVPLAVVVPPENPQHWAVFLRRLGGHELELRFENGALVDRETGSRWDPIRGQPLDEGEEPLSLLPGFTSFERDFRNHFPSGRVADADSGQS